MREVCSLPPICWRAVHFYSQRKVAQMNQNLNLWIETKHSLEQIGILNNSIKQT